MIKRSSVNYIRRVEIWERLRKHVIILHSTGIFELVKNRNVQKLLQNIEKDSIILDQMGNLGWALLFIFENFFAFVLAGAHAVNNWDICNENKGYEVIK